MARNRDISISTDTYAAIWADRKPGEDDEDAIIRRKFGVRSAESSLAANSPKPQIKVGFSDPRFGIELPENFEVFRVYQGKKYRAVARDGKWWLPNDPTGYPSFNQLSQAIGTKTENAWRNWYYTGPEGKRHLIEALRK